ncbi:MAG: hypothetical protein Q4D79_15660 [Propionibacteriaceae bacterium]|nr:hypothetical protein [Propionibacteriaceae bacterium]
MSGASGYANQRAAEAALRRPGLGIDALAEMFRNYPELRASVVAYDGVSPPLLAWITAQDDEAAAEATRRRLRQLAAPSETPPEPKGWFVRWLRRAARD